MIKTILTIFLIVLLKATSAQNIELPSLFELTESIDNYYNELTASQKKEHEETNRLRFLNYIPSPSYNPFAGGFAATLNLSAPLQEFKIKRDKRQRNASIEKLNELQAKELKNKIFLQLKSIKISISETTSKNIIDTLKEKSYNLSSQQYEKNDISPSEFLQVRQNFEAYKIQRQTEKNEVNKQIIQLLIDAKKIVITSNDLFKKD